MMMSMTMPMMTSMMMIMMSMMVSMVMIMMSMMMSTIIIESLLNNHWSRLDISSGGLDIRSRLNVGSAWLNVNWLLVGLGLGILLALLILRKALLLVRKHEGVFRKLFLIEVKIINNKEERGDIKAGKAEIIRLW